MKAPEFLEAFAGQTGEPLKTLKTIDRAIADANLRSKGRGLNAPDMSTRDALHVALGMLSAREKSRAEKDASAIAAFKPTRLYVDKGNIDDLLIAIGLTSDEVKTLSLIETLEKIAAHSATAGDDVQSADVWVKVELGGDATLIVRGPDFEGELDFSGCLELTPDDLPRLVGGVTRYAVMGPGVLTWIGRVTSKGEAAI